MNRRRWASTLWWARLQEAAGAVHNIQAEIFAQPDFHRNIRTEIVHLVHNGLRVEAWRSNDAAAEPRKDQTAEEVRGGLALVGPTTATATTTAAPPTAAGSNSSLVLCFVIPPDLQFDTRTSPRSARCHCHWRVFH